MSAHGNSPPRWTTSEPPTRPRRSRPQRREISRPGSWPSARVAVTVAVKACNQPFTLRKQARWEVLTSTSRARSPPRSPHTYYVEAGDTPVLVHNSSCSIGSVTGPNGESIPLPEGAPGVPVDSGKGFAYDIPSGTEGLDPRVVQVRVMDPVTTGRYQYPNGYVVYMNKAGQSVNPLTGQTISRADPYNHIPIP